MLGSVLVVSSVSENGRRSLGSGLLSAKIAGGLARSKIGRGVEMRAGYEKWSGFCKNCRGLSVRRVFGF